MKHQPVLPVRLRNGAALLLVWMLLIAAAVNVPWAVTFKRSRTTVNQVPTASVHGAEPARPWPARTPHDAPWPTPTHWTEGRVFGCRVYDVRFFGAEEGSGNFAMSVQHLGWPLPVLEQKRMWWDWSDPALAGPESDPAMSLLASGLILNPLILGGGTWAILVLPWAIGIVGVRWFRRRRNRCLGCGYPIGTSAVCTECGSALKPTSNG